MNYLYFFAIFLPIVLTSLPESEFVTCDAINNSKCKDQYSSSECEKLLHNCIAGYRKWENFSKYLINIEFNPNSNLKIAIQPKRGSLMENLTVQANVYHCNSNNCNAKHHFDFETTIIYEFKNGNLRVYK